LHDGADPLSAGIEAAAGALVHPLRAVRGAGSVEVAPCDAPGVVVEAVKRAEDGSGDLIVRLWESRGARSSGRLRVAGRHAQIVDLLERPLADLPIDGGGVVIALRPHQITTIRVSP
jgi:alpha-mannosidase